jgi:hypothetical protein
LPTGGLLEQPQLQYETPTVSDYGDLLELTGHKIMEGVEDGCMKTTDGGTCSEVMAFGAALV